MSGGGNIHIEFRDTSASQYDGNAALIQFKQENGKGKLFIGDRHSGTFLQLKHRKCRTVVCCSSGLSGSCLEADVKYLKIDPLEGEDSEWDKAYSLIDSELESGRNVVLQCESGNGKSAAVAMYFVMKSQSISLEKSYKLVEDCRRSTKLRPPLLQCLIDREKLLRSGVTSMYLEGGKKMRFGVEPGHAVSVGKGKDDGLLDTVIKIVIYGGIVLIGYVVYLEVQKAQIKPMRGRQ
jgi:hypothetical protein